jgi:hypothetical protein
MYQANSVAELLGSLGYLSAISKALFNVCFDQADSVQYLYCRWLCYQERNSSKA